MITKVQRSGKSWQITYDYWLSNRIASKKKTRSPIFDSQYKPTFSVAEQYARQDLINFLGHSRGQYGYTGLKVVRIGKVQPVLYSTKFADTAQPSIMQVSQRPANQFE